MFGNKSPIGLSETNLLKSPNLMSARNPKEQLGKTNNCDAKKQDEVKVSRHLSFNPQNFH